jgi:CHASE2 domain-containing sensor protein
MRFVGVGALLALAVTSCFIFSPGIIGDLDGRVYDAIAGHAGSGQPSGNVVIVAIDDTSLAHAGRWPWPRDVMAKLIRRIAESGASTIVLDLMFPEPDGVAPAAGARLAPCSSASDQELARAIAGGRVVLGYYFGFDSTAPGSPSCVITPASLVIEQTASASRPFLFRPSSALCSVPLIAHAAALTGFLNGAPDSDGRLRRLPLMMKYRDNIYPSLALAAVIANSSARWLKLAGDSSGTVFLSIDFMKVPLDRRGDLLLRFRGKSGSLAHVSAWKVLSSSDVASPLRGKIAVVGSSAVGVEPTVPTSVDAFLPGVELQATAIDNLLRQDFFSRPGWTRAIELAAGLIAGFAASVVLFAIRPVWGLAVELGLCALAWFGSLAIIRVAGIFVSPLPVLATVAVEFAALTPLRLTLERKHAADAERRLAAAKKFMLNVFQSLTASQDSETANHLTRMQRYMRLLCEAAARKPEFRKALTRETIELLVQLAPIHDIGKIGVPDQILAKPGPLSFEEWEAMKSHVEFGYGVLEHERWDGRGYPQGLAREAIPLSGRLLAVADVYDALISNRFYKSAIPHAEAARMIVAGSGRQFDPAVIDAFLQVRTAWQEVSEEVPGGRVV